jgi:hypothetical protein
MDWLCYLASNSQTALTIFIYSFLSKAIGGVKGIQKLELSKNSSPGPIFQKEIKRF